MFEVPGDGEIQKPSINEPLVFPPVLIVTDVGRKVGVIVIEVPRKASEVIDKV
jgi:hypothetical protein